jgi:hypothetical protein
LLCIRRNRERKRNTVKYLSFMAVGAPWRDTNSKIADLYGVTQGIYDTITIGDLLINAI